MQIRRYLVVNSRGSCKITKTSPSLEADEIKLELNIRLPDELFKKPQLRANITIDDSAVSKNILDAEVVDNIQESIKSVSGIDLKITVEAGE